MEFLKLNLIKIITLILVLFHHLASAQEVGIVLDSLSKKPIPFVSIYTIKGKEILGTSSEVDGKFKINFPFETIFFKHINYKDKVFTNDMRIDSVYLSPQDNILEEVIVPSNQKPWIKNLLIEVVKNKSKNYPSTPGYYQYDYKTHSLSDSTGYAFGSFGKLLIPNYMEKKDFEIAPELGIIKYKDTTAGCDFSSFQKILYDDKFLVEFNKHFVNSHSFTLNSDQKSNNSNYLEFYFKSKKDLDDAGRIVVDTLNKAIVEYQRVTGTRYNVKSRTNFVFRNFASKAMGFNYKEMNSEIHVKFMKIGENYYISESKMRGYISSERKIKKKLYTNFSSMEAVLKLNYLDKLNGTINFIYLPKPMYIGIETRRDQQSYKALQQIKKTYEDFNIFQD